MFEYHFGDPGLNYTFFVARNYLVAWNDTSPERGVDKTFPCRFPQLLMKVMKRGGRWDTVSERLKANE